MLDSTSRGTDVSTDTVSYGEPAACVAAVTPVPAEPAPTRALPSTAVCFGGVMLLVFAGGVLGSVGAPGFLVGPLLVAALVAFLFTVFMAAGRVVIGVVDLGRAAAGSDEVETLPTVLALLGNLAMTAFGAFVAWLSTFGFSRGRQLRRFGRLLLPSLQEGSDWSSRPSGIDTARRAPDGVAQQWRENGRTEHASVAAFARVTLDLMALGAPPSLVADAQKDALDEIRHAELCFSLARDMDGRDEGPAPFPAPQHVSPLPRSRPLALAKLAVDSLVDGALHEGVSARVIAKLARRAEDPALREMLKEIAADEGRHAAHGWAVVRWCVEEGGQPVQSALWGALHTLPVTMQSERPPAAADGAWEPWGIHGHRLEADEYAAALAHLRQRVAALSATARRRAA
jgi:hypothetical protein